MQLTSRQKCPGSELEAWTKDLPLLKSKFIVKIYVTAQKSSV